MDNKDDIINKTPELKNSSLEPFGDIDFQRFILVLRKSIVWIALILIISFTASYIYMRYTVPIFESNSVLKLEMKSDVDALGIPGLQKPNIVNNLSGEIELIKSELIYDQVIKKIPQLKTSYYSKGRIKDEERFLNSFFILDYNRIDPVILDNTINLKIIDQSNCIINYKINNKEFSYEVKFNKAYKTEHMDFTIKSRFEDYNEIDQNDYYIKINSRDALVQMLHNNLEVQIINRNANTLKIIYRDPNPIKAKVIVEGINTVYLENTLELKNQASKQTINFLDKQLQKTEDQLVEVEREIEGFIKQNNTVNFKESYNKHLDNVESLNSELRKNKEKLILLNALENNYQSEDTSKLENIFSSNPAFDHYRSLIVKLSERRHKLELIEQSNNKNTVAYKLVSEEVVMLENNLKTAFSKDKKLLEEENQILRSNLAKMESEIRALPGRETEYNRLKRQYDLSEKFYLLLMDKKAEFGISEAGIIPDFQVLSPASNPISAVFPKPFEVYAIGFGIGIFVSVLLITIRFISHNTIDSIEEIEKNLNIPMLGTVPLHKFKSKHTKLVVLDNPKSELSEAIRTIRTNLDFMIPNNGGKKLLSVTSTVGGEGKTFISVNLGAIIAMSKKKVVLLDLDMRKPKLHLALGKENNFGMSNILAGQSSLEEVIKNSDFENLDFISSGPPPPNPSELILLKELDNIIDRLKEIYDVIIIDSPPIGLVTDGLLIMKKVDLSLYIIKSEFSKRSFLKNIEKLQSQNQIKHMAVVFNSVKKRGGGYGYGYGYGYLDTSGYYEEKQDKGIFKLF